MTIFPSDSSSHGADSDLWTLVPLQIAENLRLLEPVGSDKGPDRKTVRP